MEFTETGMNILFLVYVERGGGHIEGMFKENVKYPVLKTSTIKKYHNTKRELSAEQFFICGENGKFGYVDHCFCRLALERQ